MPQPPSVQRLQRALKDLSSDKTALTIMRASDQSTRQQRDVPVDWGYAVAFKGPRDTTLSWVFTRAKDVVEASRAARRHIGLKEDTDAIREYGSSKSYWQDFPGWRAALTRDEYEQILSDQQRRSGATTAGTPHR